MKSAAGISILAALLLAVLLAVPVEHAGPAALPGAGTSAGCEPGQGTAQPPMFRPWVEVSAAGRGLRSRIGTLQPRCRPASTGQAPDHPGYALQGWFALQFEPPRRQAAADPGSGEPMARLILWDLRQGQWRISRVLRLH